MMRYQRQISLEEVGLEGQQRLAKASVLVIGAGGLGCPILQYLAVAGLGKLGIADMDTVSLSNLHRQVLYTEADVNRPKVEAAYDRLKAVNKDLEIQLYPEGFHAENALEMIASYDLIIDGTDNFETRYLVNDACVRAGKPWIYGALFKQEGQFALFNHRDSATYRCLYPEPPMAGEVPNCNELGILGTVSGLVGLQMAHMALQFILWPDSAPTATLFYCNLKDFSQQTLKIKRNDLAVSQLQQSDQPLKRISLLNCETPEGYSIENALKSEGSQLLDVRYRDEAPLINDSRVLHIPIDELAGRLESLNPLEAYYCYCISGARAEKAVRMLKDHGFDKVYKLSESVEQIKNHLKKSKTQSHEVH